MDKEIEIKIQNDYELWSILFFISLFVVLFILFLVICFFSVLKLLFCILFCGIGVFFFILAVRPTDIWSDGKCLYWKHLFKLHSLKLCDITDMKCEPYTVQAVQVKYGKFYRIKLTLRTTNNDEEEIEFNDNVKPEELLNEKLGNAEADIPVIQLYDYLKEHIYIEQ